MPLRTHDFLAFVRLSRPVNLLITAAAFSLAALLSAGNRHFLQDALFWAELGLVLCITAGGYWINDVFDRRIDRINKPGRVVVSNLISAKKVFTGYFVLTSAAVIASFSLVPTALTAVNLVAVWLLYMYSQVFKRTAVIGNLLISLLTALVIFAGAYLYHPYRFSIIWAMVFAFLITFIREVTKDIEDVKGDLQYKLRTLPILIGIRNSKKVLIVSYAVLFVAASLPWVVNLLLWNEFLYVYFTLSIFFIQLPLVGLGWLTLYAYSTKNFRKLSQLQKLLMLTGMLSLLSLLK